MEQSVHDVTDAELAVLQARWERGSATIRQLTDALYPGGSTAQYATVQKLLERLEAKGCAGRDRKPWPHVFTATVDRDDLIGRRLRVVAEKLCGGSLTPLLTHLLAVERLSPEERQELRAVLDGRSPKPGPDEARPRKDPIVSTLLGIGLANAVMAAALALLAAVVGRVWKKPALRHGLWLLVLLKL